MPMQPCGGHDMNTPDGMFAYGFCQTGVSAAVSKVGHCSLDTAHLHSVFPYCFYLPVTAV